MLGISLDALLVILLTGWTVKEADERGRNRLGWALVCLGAGVLATSTGYLLANEIIAGDLGDERAVLSMIPLLLLPLVSMVAVTLFVRRLPPVAHVRRGVPVRRIGARGEDDAEGVLRVGPDGVRLELAGSTEELAGAKASVDGECLRLSWTAAAGDREALLLPLGRPNTSAGRRRQSEALTFMIRSRPR